MKSTFTLVLSCLFYSVFSQGIVWEDQGLADEAAITSGSSFTDDVAQHSVTVTWNTVTNGGSFVKCCGDDFVSFEEGKQGNHPGFVCLGFNNSLDDPADKICVTFTFNPPVDGLQFTLLDVDEADDDDFSSRNQWDDAVEVFYNGNINAKDFGTLAGPCVYKDSEQFMDGFEGETYNSSPCGDDGTDNESTDANVNFDFGDEVISSITVKYFSSDDLGIMTNNPDVQLIGVSDLIWNITLPVQFISFSVDAYTPMVNLAKWVTANEINNDYFEIQRSEDGQNFKTIGKIKAQGNNGREQEYYFKDYKPNKGYNYYRLKQMDKNGAFSFSDIRSIYNNHNPATPSLAVWPNPVLHGLINVIVSESERSEIEILDDLSRVVKKSVLVPGQEQLDVSDLNPGVYFLRIINRENEAVSFVIAER